MDTEQNERLQEEEHEIVRLWKARNSVLSQLESSKQPILSPIDDNTSISEIESVTSQQTDYPKVKFQFLQIEKNSFCFFSFFKSLYQMINRKVHELFSPHVYVVLNQV